MTTTTRWWWVRHAPVTVNNGCVYGQTDLPGKGPCVGDLLPVEGDESALLRPIEVGLTVYADDGDLIVGEQVAFDRLAERESVEHGPELGGGATINGL